MADNIDYSRYSGHVAFPRDASDLLSTSQCPACFTSLTSTVCATCGLDLGHAAATELHDASLAASEALDKRLTIIGRIRYDTAQTAAAQQAAAQAEAAQREAAQAAAAQHAVAQAAAAHTSHELAAEAQQVTALASTPTSAIPAPPESAPPVQAPAVPAALERRSKHSSVQVTMLIVGVSLLSIAAIFFLVYAFINFGIIWRSVIIAAITVAAIVTASFLRRRKLTATAEGIAVFGVVLVYLDAFALRANDFFGLASADGLVYWGATIVAISVAFMFWHRMSTLRAPSIVGFSAFAPGIGLLVAGLVQGGDFGTRPFLTAAAIAAAGLIHRAFPLPTTATPLPGTTRNIERVIILSTTALAVVAGFSISFTIAPTSDWSGTIAALALVAITVAHLWALAPQSVTQPTKTFAYIFSSLGAIIAASAVSIAALRIGTNPVMSLAPAISAVVVALALEAIVHRGAAGWRKFGIVGAWSAAGVFALALITPLFVASTWTLLLPTLGITKTWLLSATDDVSLTMAHPGWSVLSLAIVGVLAAAFWIYSGVIRQRGPILAWFGAGTFLAAVTLPATLWITLASWLAIALISVTLLSLRKTRAAIALAYRAVLAAAAIASGLFGYLISWAGHSTWWIASTIVVALLLVSRRIVTANAAKATLLGVATVLALVGSFAAALHITYIPLTFGPSGPEVINGVRFASIVAAVLFGAFAVPLGRTVTHTDRRVMFWLTGAASLLLLVTLSNGLNLLGGAARVVLLLPEYAMSLVVQAALLAGIILWIAVPISKTLRPERATASIAAAPAAYATAVAITKTVNLPEFVTAIAPIVAALVVAAAAVAISTARRTSAHRWALDIGVVLVALPAVAFAVFSGMERAGGEFGWIVLLLAAVTVLFLAISHDGLFASTSWRKQLGWLAIALATAGLWWRLGSSQVDALEPYVLPLAGVLLATALLIARSEHKAPSQRTATTGGSDDSAVLPDIPSRSAAPLVALGGLLVAILPLGINAITGSVTRAIVLASVSTALLLLGSLIIMDRTRTTTEASGIRWQPWLDTAALAGALGVLVTAIGRATMSHSTEWTGDMWLAGALVVLLAAGIGQARRAGKDDGRLRAAGSQALAIIPLTAVLAIEANALHPPQFGGWRALGLIVLFATITALCSAVNRAPFGRAVGGVSTVFWAIATVATLVTFPRDLLLSLAPISSAMLVGAVALTTTLLRPGPVNRWSSDQGVIAVGGLSVLISIAQNAPHTWLVLLIAAVTVLLLAIDSDGLFSSTSWRRRLAWISLALATGGLWWRLFGDGVTDLAPYVLPLGAALLVVALLLERAKSKLAAEETHNRGQAAPVIALGGLVVAILPLAVNAANGEAIRAIIIAGVSAALLLAGSFVIGSRAAQRWWDSAALAGVIGVLVLMIGRAIFLPFTDVSRDAWIVGGFVLLVIAAFGQAFARNAETDRIRATASQILGLIAMTAVLVTEVPAFREQPIGNIRALGLVFLFSAIHVIAQLLQSAPFSRLVGWIAIGFAAIAAYSAVSMGAIETPEFVTVPIAISLLITGTMHLRDVAAARSWAWLAPGMVILLLPTLIETFRDQALWRIVGLGVVGVAVIILGVMRKLQAPFVIGVVVVLIHGISTFLPQLRAAYEVVPWWLWLGIGGAALVAVAVRFEQRRRDLKTVVTKFAELR